MKLNGVFAEFIRHFSFFKLLQIDIDFMIFPLERKGGKTEEDLLPGDDLQLKILDFLIPIFTFFLQFLRFQGKTEKCLLI